LSLYDQQQWLQRLYCYVQSICHLA
jgi:hypothetical protein